MALAEARTLEVQRHNLVRDLPTFRSKMPGLYAREVENVEDGFTLFSRRLVASLSNLAAARRRGFGGALNRSMDPLQEISAAFDTELAESAPNVSGGSSANQ